jgi:putative tricarboxylic transport membrane protein
MDLLTGMKMGFAVAVMPQNMLYCLFGVTLGTLIGILPGIGPAATLALLLPMTFGMNPASAMIMMAGIYYGAMYGGSTTSILLSIPGESSSVMTCLDGYQMAKKGRAGPALAIAAISSFIAGTFGVVMLMLVAVPLADSALKFGPPEFFALMLWGLSAVAYLSEKSLLKALIMAAFGVFVSTIGVDIVSGTDRFTYDQAEILDGIDFLILIVGFFAVSEVLLSIEKEGKAEIFQAPRKMRELMPSKQDLRDSSGAIARGTLTGFLLGIIPGVGPSVASFLAYGLEKRFAKRKDLIGTGAIEGVASPEGANNAAATAALIPLLCLGIPSSGVAAIMLGALILNNVRPGPMLLQEHPDLVWGVIGSMYIGNVVLLILNLPMVPFLAQILRVPYYILYPLILLLSFVGVYSVNNSLFDIYLLLFFGIMGYGLRKMDFPMAPAILGIVLGPRMEFALRQSLILSHGSWTIFFTEPICAVLLVGLFLMLVSRPLRKWIGWTLRRRRQNLAGH